RRAANSRNNGKPTLPRQDHEFERKHPELRDPAVRVKLFNAAIDYLKDKRMSEAEIAANWQGVGNEDFRFAAKHEALLELARYHLAKKNLANRPKKAAPPVQKPGARGAVEPRSRFADLEDRFARTGSARDAGRLIAARRSAARRG